MDTQFRNAKIVLADEVIDGSLHVADGNIAAIDAGGAVGEDLEGDFLIPGLVELHTDHLEGHYRPRQNVYWNPLAALQAHDTQIAGSGITTVFDALRIGTDPELPDNMDQQAAKLLEAIEHGDADGRLRADHLVHLRCELPSYNVVAHFEQFCAHPLVRLASVMDHTPGQRQYQSVSHYAAYYQVKMRLSDEDFAKFIAERQAEQAQWSDPNRKAIFKRGHELGIVFASHDDATPEHVAESLRDGVAIAEFPTTLIAAQQSHEAGLAVLMGAPNIVRGQSHSGNVSANELAAAGCLDVVSSDYVPFAMLQAPFILADKIETISLPEAINKVSRNPATAAGLTDRGEIAVGKRADLVRVRLMDGIPVVKGVWRQGQRVS